jgi:hypothetical protein
LNNVQYNVNVVQAWEGEMPVQQSILKACIAAAALASLAACAAHRVEGLVEGGREAFSGGSFREVDGGGVLTVRSSLGAVCSGDFVYVRPREGVGTFSCSDGRTGPFSFVSTGLRGTGTGTVGGRRFVFSFGLGAAPG